MRRPWMLPLVPLYGAGVALRAAGFALGVEQVRRLRYPVVSVGNISAGGAGKTPFTIALAQLLTREGFAVDVLSRGYGRSSTAVMRVSPEGTADAFGDEPLLIAREAGVPVYVGADRWEAGVLAEAGSGTAGPSTPLPHPSDEDLSLGTPVRSAQDDSISFMDKKATARHIHLLDDGFQHRRLYRDLDLVLVSSEDLGDRLLPAGNLREGLGALRRASVLAVLVGDDAAVERLRGMGLEQPIWRFRREMAAPLVHGPVVAFCGIARPEQFFAGLALAGLEIAGRKVFRDHHAFAVEDVEALRRLVQESGAAALVTTAKDRVRMGDLAADLEVAAPLVTAGLRVVLEEEAVVAGFLRGVLDGNDKKSSL